MNYWKKHPVVRTVLMAVFFATGLLFVLFGWSLTGQLYGLMLMLLGIVLMLTALWLYNKAYR